MASILFSRQYSWNDLGLHETAPDSSVELRRQTLWQILKLLQALMCASGDPLSGEILV